MFFIRKNKTSQYKELRSRVVQAHEAIVEARRNNTVATSEQVARYMAAVDVTTTFVSSQKDMNILLDFQELCHLHSLEAQAFVADFISKNTPETPTGTYL